LIPCANPHAQYTSQKVEIDAAISRLLASGMYILGDEVRAFEKEFAAYLGAREAIGVGSGTEALHIALVACGVGRGDEVITVGHTAVATVAAIELAGATPVLVDIDPEHCTLDPELLDRAITRRTKAVIPVHLYGQPADLDAILSIARAHGLRVIEDCAQCHGAMYGDRRAGTLGDLGCFSFYPTKNLGAIGDGGAIVTSDSSLAERARLIREYGWAERYVSHIPGWNSRLDPLQAAILRVKLTRLDDDNARRQAIAERYDSGLADAGLVLPRRRVGSTHVFHLYVVRSEDRAELQSFLRDRGIGTLVHYPVPVHQQPAYATRVRVPHGGLRETERTAREVLSLPMFPELGQDEVRAVISAIRVFEPKSLAGR
jgi:dTDP-4-amino-4,6-dideoxygalactose transaminase